MSSKPFTFSKLLRLCGMWLAYFVWLNLVH